MLTIYGRRQQFCDRLSRRSFLQIGALGLGAGALSLADVLRAEAAGSGAGARGRSSHKAVIHVFLGGGPPHQDMWEIKTEAPQEIRGEFRPIPTKVPGIQIGETFPKIAGMMDKCAVIRSVVGAVDRHEPYQCHTGWTRESLMTLGGRPAIGSAISKLRGPVDRSVPPFVGLANAGVWKDPGQPGYLGPAYGPFMPDGPGMANMKLNDISLERLEDRKQLRASFDAFRRIVDTQGHATAHDAFTERAFDVLTSSRLLEALDLNNEDPRVRERYGTGKPFQYQYDGAPTDNEHLLMARRLVEAGVRCVTTTYGRWDSHGANFDLVRDHGSKLDQGFSALVEDLEQRGMLDDVTVIAWGEFGRTPRINKDAGRDHWPRVSCALLAGGGMRTGQAIGSTDRLGGEAHSRPVHMQEVVATLYHNLGIDTSSTTIRDATGRPQYLVEHGPIRELV
ncbi:MAG: DUF1501 domain-containing protein [Planctomycetota bacterium]|nr:MAG: DUF1501 domain-containing protein [Planctomycetota bacterium]